MGIEKAIVEWFQAAYDYLWDRWGIYVGHVRIAAGSIMFIGNVIDHTVVTPPKGPVVAMLIGNGIYMMVQWAMFHFLVFRAHASEVELQKKGKYDQLNLITMSFMRGGPIIKTLIGVVWLVSVYLFGFNDLSVLSYGISGFLWYYTGTIMVRDRDAGRFKQDSFAIQGT